MLPPVVIDMRVKAIKRFIVLAVLLASSSIRAEGVSFDDLVEEAKAQVGETRSQIRFSEETVTVGDSTYTADSFRSMNTPRLNSQNYEQQYQDTDEGSYNDHDAMINESQGSTDMIHQEIVTDLNSQSRENPYYVDTTDPYWDATKEVFAGDVMDEWGDCNVAEQSTEKTMYQEYSTSHTCTRPINYEMECDIFHDIKFDLTEPDLHDLYIRVYFTYDVKQRKCGSSKRGKNCTDINTFTYTRSATVNAWITQWDGYYTGGGGVYNEVASDNCLTYTCAYYNPTTHLFVVDGNDYDRSINSSTMEYRRLRNIRVTMSGISRYELIYHSGLGSHVLDGMSQYPSYIMNKDIFRENDSVRKAYEVDKQLVLNLSKSGYNNGHHGIRVYLNYPEIFTVEEDNWYPDSCIDRVNQFMESECFVKNNLELTDIVDVLEGPDSDGCLYYQGYQVCEGDARHALVSESPIDGLSNLTVHARFSPPDACAADRVENGCEKFDKRSNCSKKETDCIKNDLGDNLCTLQVETWECEERAEQQYTSTDFVTECGGEIACFDGSCQSNPDESAVQDMGKTIGVFSAFDEINRDAKNCIDTDIENCEIFKAKENTCKIVDWVAFRSNCCDAPDSGVSISEWFNVAKKGRKVLELAYANIEPTSGTWGWVREAGDWYNETSDSFGNAFTHLYEQSKQKMFSSPGDTLTASAPETANTGVATLEPTSANDATIFDRFDTFKQQLVEQIQKAAYEMLESAFGESTANLFVKKTAEGTFENGAVTNGVSTIMSIYGYYQALDTVFQSTIGKCEDHEMELALKKEQLMTHYIGERDGSTGETLEVYCQWDSPFNRIVMTQIAYQDQMKETRADPNRFFGTASNPDCSGIKINDLALVNWDAINWDEWIGLLMEGGMIPAPDKMLDMTGKDSVYSSDEFERENVVDRNKRKWEGSEMDLIRQSMINQLKGYTATGG